MERRASIQYSEMEFGEESAKRSLVKVGPKLRWIYSSFFAGWNAEHITCVGDSFLPPIAFEFRFSQYTVVVCSLKLCRVLSSRVQKFAFGVHI